MFLSRFLFWCFLFLFFEEPAAIQTPAQIPRPAIIDYKSYTEIYTFTAQLEDQTFVQVQMTVTNLGYSNKNATSKILILHAAEKPWKWNRWYDQKKWAYSDTPNPSLSIGSCRIMQLKDRIEFSGFLDEAVVHIISEAVSLPVKPPNADYNCNPGKTSETITGKKFYEYEILMPWSKVQTTLTFPGKPPKKLQGYGMLEHSRSVGHPREISQGWVTFRGYQAGSHFLANFRLPPEKKAPIVGWIWKDDAPAPLAINGLLLKTQSFKVKGKEKKIQVISALDNSFCITSKKRLYRYSFIDELGPILGYIVKLIVGNPVTCYYDAQVQLTAEKTSVQGVLELMNIE